jgi:hypothetical protein
MIIDVMTNKDGQAIYALKRENWKELFVFNVHKNKIDEFQFIVCFEENMRKVLNWYIIYFNENKQCFEYWFFILVPFVMLYDFVVSKYTKFMRYLFKR